MCGHNLTWGEARAATEHVLERAHGREEGAEKPGPGTPLFSKTSFDTSKVCLDTSITPGKTLKTIP